MSESKAHVRAAVRLVSPTRRASHPKRDRELRRVPGGGDGHGAPLRSTGGHHAAAPRPRAGRDRRGHDRPADRPSEPTQERGPHRGRPGIGADRRSWRRAVPSGHRQLQGDQRHLRACVRGRVDARDREATRGSHGIPRHAHAMVRRRVHGHLLAAAVRRSDRPTRQGGPGELRAAVRHRRNARPRQAQHGRGRHPHRRRDPGRSRSERAHRPAPDQARGPPILRDVRKWIP